MANGHTRQLRRRMLPLAISAAWMLVVGGYTPADFGPDGENVDMSDTDCSSVGSCTVDCEYCQCYPEDPMCGGGPPGGGSGGGGGGVSSGEGDDNGDEEEGFCGDGDTDPGESCDPPGTAVGSFGLCRDDCTYCGDEHLDLGEECDDGNAVSGDGCEYDCTRTPTATCTISQVPSGAVWWFGGQDVEGYNEEITLTVSGATGGTFARVQGAAKLERKSGTDTTVVYTTDVATDWRYADPITPVLVQYRVDSIPLCEHTIVVLAPTVLDHLSTLPITVPPYATQVTYRLLDQVGYILPDDVPVNESFSGHDTVVDWPGTPMTWTITCNDVGNSQQTGGCGDSVSPNNFYDTLTRPYFAGVPSPVHYDDPDAFVSVLKRGGAWFVGSYWSGEGLRVSNYDHWATPTVCTWHKYLGWGDHE